MYFLANFLHWNKSFPEILEQNEKSILCSAIQDFRAGDPRDISQVFLWMKSFFILLTSIWLKSATTCSTISTQLATGWL